MDDRLIRYDRDGGVTLVAGDRHEAIPPGWTDAELDAWAAAFFGAGDAAD